MLVFAVFYILKMRRAFSGSSVQGGIWNYIQLFFVALGFALFAIYIVRFINCSIVMSICIYSALSLINGMIYLHMNQSEVFRYLLIPYAFCILIIACVDGFYNDISSNFILTVTFYICAAMYIIPMLRNGGYSTKTGAVADVYYVLGLLPMMLIWTKRFKIIPMSVCGIAVLVSGKRAGIFAFALMIIGYYLLNIFVSENVLYQLTDLLKLAVIILLFIIVFNYLDSNFNNKLLSRMMRAIEEQDTAGRAERWDRIITAFRENNAVQWVFGNGNGAVSREFGGNAHNDYLEIIYNFGVVAFLGYVTYSLTTVRELLRMIFAKYEYAPQFLMTIIFSIIIAFFSFYVIDSTYITSGMLCVGYMMVDFRKKHMPHHALIRDLDTTGNVLSERITA